MHVRKCFSFMCQSLLSNVCFIKIRTGKSLSKALILGSTNPQYDKRLFIDLQVQYIKTISSEHDVYTNCFCFDIQNNLCTQHVLSL